MAESILKKQLQESEALNRFFRWWLGELKTWVPSRMQRFFSRQRGRLLIDVDNEVSRFLLSVNGDERLLGVCDLLALTLANNMPSEELEEKRRQFRQQAPQVASGVEVIVQLPERVFLIHEIELPLATEANLASVLQFELDRITPFRPGQARFGYQVIARQPERDRVRVRLVVIKQAVLTALIECLSENQLTVSAVVPSPSITGSLANRIAPGAGVENLPQSSWNLLPPESRPKPQPVWTTQNRNLAALTAVSLLAVIAMPHYLLTQKINDLNEQIEKIEDQAREVGKKQALLLQKTDVGTTLINRKNTEFTKLDIIRDLTDLIGEDTWISNLDIKGNTVNMSGESKQASVLIELLEQFPGFQNVSFESPVTRNAVTDKERFEIKLELTNGGQKIRLTEFEVKP